MPTATPAQHTLHHTGSIVEVQQLAPLIWAHRCHIPEIAASVHPGQFVHMRITEGSAPLLRRPFSVLDANPRDGTFRILFKVVGVGTQIMTGFRAGDPVDMLGPLGSAFNVPRANKRLLMIAGGIGMVPLYFLAKKLFESRRGIEVDYWFGARDAEEIYLLDDLRQWCNTVVPVSEDAGFEKRGRVTDFANEWGSPNLVLTCGPTAMLREVQRITRDMNFPVYGALESFMGCGLGACLGCVLNTTDAGYERVCTEGPVFDLHRLELGP